MKCKKLRPLVTKEAGGTSVAIRTSSRHTYSAIDADVALPTPLISPLINKITVIARTTERATWTNSMLNAYESWEKPEISDIINIKSA